MDDFAAPTGIDWNGSVGKVQYGGGDRSMVVMFFTKPQHNPGKSTEAGRPIYDDVPYVRIHPPGERLNIVERPVQQASDSRRFPQQWAAFQQGRQQIPDGTPIDLLYPDHPSIGAMLRASNVYTIEQCAELSGPAIDNIGMGAQRYCNDAQKYLQASNKGVKASQLRHELDERDSQIRTLTQTVETLKTEVDRLREANTNSLLLHNQQVVSGHQARPQYPAGAPKQMDPAFDSQTAQINATHTTADVVRGSKRKRARIAS